MSWRPTISLSKVLCVPRCLGLFLPPTFLIFFAAAEAFTALPFVAPLPGFLLTFIFFLFAGLHFVKCAARVNI